MKKLTLAVLASLGVAVGLCGPAQAQIETNVTTTPYTFLNSDCDPNGLRLVTFGGTAATAVTLPQAGASGNFLNGCRITAFNVSAFPVTITPTTSTINSQTSLVLQPGAGTVIHSDATPLAVGNYQAEAGLAGTAGVAGNTPRNLVQNGDMIVRQRGTGEQTGGTTTIPASAYSADRWGCNANVTSGAAFCAALTTGPTGFRGSQSVYRKSGALLQPVCMMQEITTTDILPSAGSTMTLSFYAKALAGMIADNGGIMNAYIFTGTGTDQGLQSFTASPAITPAWTGIGSTLTKAFTLTTSYQRFSYTFALGSTVTEAAVAFCFTPTASGAGTTDGFNFSGVQLETGWYPSPYEFKPLALELLIAQQFYFEIDETTAGTPRAMCTMTTSGTAAACVIQYNTTMRTTPVITTATGFSLGTTTGQTALNNCTGFVALATLTTHSSPNQGAVACTNSSGTTAALGIGMILFDNGGSGKFQASADF